MTACRAYDAHKLYTAVSCSLGVLELLRSGRISADFWEWRVGAPFKFKKSEDAEEGPPTADAAAADDEDASTDASAPSADGEPADVMQGMSMGDKRVADAAVCVLLIVPRYEC